MKPAIRFLSTLISSSLVFVLVINTVARLSPKEFPIQTQVQTLLEAEGVRRASYTPVEQPPGGPVVPQDDLLDAATRNWLKGLDGTRREVALLLIETVAESGSKVTAVGSWVNKASYKDPLTGGTSDHDMRLVMDGATETEAVAKWDTVRSKLIGKIRAHPTLGRNAQKVLESINLYPPDVILEGITEPADAVAKLKRLGMNPNLGNAPIEGFWGEDGKVFRNAYETKSGRAIWTAFEEVDGKMVRRVASGFADLATYGGEVVEVWTMGGAANLASQAVDKVGDALRKYDGRVFQKQLERLEQFMKKSRDLGKLEKAGYAEGLLKELEECCAIRNDAGKIVGYEGSAIKTMLIEPANRVRIDSMLRKAKLDAELLRKLSYSTHPRDIELFRNMLEEGTGRWARVRNALSEASAHVPWGPLLTALVVYLVYIQTKEYAANVGAGEQEKVFRGLLADASFVASIPAGILTLLVNSIIEDAKDAGYALVTSYQDCEDLIAGIYEVKGRERVSEQKKIETNINQLAITFTEPEEIIPIVALHAREAAKRDNTGKVTEQVDAKIEEDLNKRCGPRVIDKWQKRRMELIADAVEKVRLIADEIESTNAAGVTAPDPASLKNGTVNVEVRANFSLNGASASKKIQDFINTLKPLGGQHKLVAIGVKTSYRWSRDGVQLSFDERDYNPAARPVFEQSLATKKMTF